MNKQQLRNRIRSHLEEQQKQKAEKMNAITGKHTYNRSSEFYQSGRWKRLREYIMSRHPICFNCKKHGIVTPATEIHHCIPFLTGENKEAQWDLFLDYSNLVPLCSYCHDKIHSLMRKRHQIIDIRYTDEVLPKKIYERNIEEGLY